MSIEEFRLRRNLNQFVLTIGIPVFMLLILIVVAPLVILADDRDWTFIVIVVAFAFLMGIAALGGIQSPTRIELHENGEVRLIGWRRTWCFNARDVRSIRPTKGQMGMLEIVHSRGRVTITNSFDRFHVFVSRLKVLNPAIETKGC